MGSEVWVVIGVLIGWAAALVALRGFCRWEIERVVRLEVERRLRKMDEVEKAGHLQVRRGIMLIGMN